MRVPRLWIAYDYTEPAECLDMLERVLTAHPDREIIHEIGRPTILNSVLAGVPIVSEFREVFSASDPSVQGIWRNGAATFVHDYVMSHGFWSAGGPMFDNRYWLNFYIHPDWATSPEWTDEKLQQAIETARKESIANNSKPDLEIILDNFWNLPFLTK